MGHNNKISFLFFILFYFTPVFLFTGEKVKKWNRIEYPAQVSEIFSSPTIFVFVPFLCKVSRRGGGGMVSEKPNPDTFIFIFSQSNMLGASKRVRIYWLFGRRIRWRRHKLNFSMRHRRRNEFGETLNELEEMGYWGAKKKSWLRNKIPGPLIGNNRVPFAIVTNSRSPLN
jgi:hypothetical protein